MLVLLWSRTSSNGLTAASLRVVGKHSSAGVHPGVVSHTVKAETEVWEQLFLVLIAPSQLHGQLLLLVLLLLFFLLSAFTLQDGFWWQHSSPVL